MTTKVYNSRELYKAYKTRKLSENSNFLSYKHFKEGLDLVNKKISNKILNGEGTFSIKDFIKIYITKRSKYSFSKPQKRINHNASKLKKQRLIAEGRLPLENYKDENFNIIGSNGGENWLVYNTDDPFCWKLRFATMKTIPLVKNSYLFKFYASYHNKRAIKDHIEQLELSK